MQLVPLVLFVAVHLKNFFLLPSCHLTLMSFCTQGLPGVAESTISKAKENLFPGEKVPPLKEGEDYFSDDGSCDFAFRLRAE